eukprot:16442808-Heterocapsa_arctica.AAC.1
MSAASISISAAGSAARLGGVGVLERLPLDVSAKPRLGLGLEVEVARSVSSVRGRLVRGNPTGGGHAPDRADSAPAPPPGG